MKKAPNLVLFLNYLVFCLFLNLIVMKTIAPATATAITIAMIAKAYNIATRTVIEREELNDAITEMLNTDGPFLLQCAIMEEDNVLPMTPPGANVDEMLLEI